MTAQQRRKPNICAEKSPVLTRQNNTKYVKLNMSCPKCMMMTIMAVFIGRIEKKDGSRNYSIIFILNLQRIMKFWSTSFSVKIVI